MYNRQTLPTRKNVSVWSIVLCLAALAFVCRSVIPSGYMPSLSPEKGGTVVLTLCTADGGNETLLLNLQKHSKELPGGSHASHECPFGLVMSHGILPVQDLPALATLTQRQHPIVVFKRSRVLPPMPALGPPLGSRAPPSYLG